MPANAAIDTAIIFTTRMEKLAAFYREGFDLGEPNLSPGHIGFQVGHVYLGFDQVDEPWASPAATTLWVRVDDVQATFDRLVGLGASVRYPPVTKPWGDVLASVYDPDGNLVGISQRKEAAQG